MSAMVTARVCVCMSKSQVVDWKELGVGILYKKSINHDLTSESNQRKVHFFYQIFRISRPQVFCKKGLRRHFAKLTGKNLCLRPATLLKKETLAQVFSCEFCEIFKNTFITKHLWWPCFGYYTY